MKDEIRVIKNNKLTAHEKNLLDGAPLLDPDTLDAALLGAAETSEGPVAVYDYEQLIAAFMRDDPTLTYDDAVDHIGFNTLGSLPGAGPRAPWVLEKVSDEEGAANADDGENEIVQMFGAYWRKC